MMKQPNLRTLVLGVVAVWLLALTCSLLFFNGWAERGQFGDLFGSANALFSGLAFAGLYSALRVQQEQLDLQRTELHLQREELKLQRDEMAASRAELASQVRVQRAMFEASIAQILVASTQAQIEAIKMEAETKAPHVRSTYVEKIDGLAQALRELSNRVEDRAKSAA